MVAEGEAMKQQTLIRFFISGLMGLAVIGSFARADAVTEGPRACQGYPQSRSFISQQFISTLIPAVRLELRTNIFVIDRLSACLSNDGPWLQEHFGSDVERARASAQCDLRIKNLTETIARDFPKMRFLLSMIDIEGQEGDSVNERNPTQKDQLKGLITRLANGNGNMGWDRDAAKRYMTVNIAHPYSGLASLEALSNSEILNNYRALDGKVNEYLSANDATKMTLSDLRKAVYNFVDAVRADDRREYEGVITSNPILGFLTSGNPSKDELVAALATLKRNLSRQLTRLESRFYSGEGEKILSPVSLDSQTAFDDLTLYSRSIDRITRMDNSLCDGITAWTKDVKSRRDNRNIVMITLIVGGVIACEVSRFGVFAKNACRILFGLGGNVAFLGVAQNEYDQAFELMFSGPYGYGALSDIDHLNDAQFSKTLAWITLPLGTGIPIIKFIKPATWQQLSRAQMVFAHP
jgi:hypothetical protein